MSSPASPLLPLEAITTRIVTLRGQRVIVDAAWPRSMTCRPSASTRRSSATWPGSRRATVPSPHSQLSRDTRVQIKQVFDAIRELMAPPDPPRRPIGFITPEDKGKKRPTPAARGT
jgi:hypothetical protein